MRKVVLIVGLLFFLFSGSVTEAGIISSGVRFNMMKGEDFLPLFGPVVEMELSPRTRLRGSFSWGPAVKEGTFRLGIKGIMMRSSGQIRPYLGGGLSLLTDWEADTKFFDLMGGIKVHLTESISLRGEVLYTHRIIHLLGAIGSGFGFFRSF